MEPNEYLNFLKYYLKTLENLVQEMNNKDPKYIAELRLAERSFNFLLNQFPDDVIISEVIGMDVWNDLKIRRDKVANSITAFIQENPQVQERYEQYCETLKNPGQLGSLL